jgi:hypothetical protein
MNSGVKSLLKEMPKRSPISPEFLGDEEDAEIIMVPPEM